MSHDRAPGRSLPVIRRIRVGWLAVVAALATGLGMWIFHGAVGGRPGPVVQGVWLSGGNTWVIPVFYAVTAAALATLGAVMAARVPGNPIGWILGGVAAWVALTLLLTTSLYFLAPRGGIWADVGNWLGVWTYVPWVSVPLVLMAFPDGRLPSPRWWPLPWTAAIGTLAWAAQAASDPMGADPALPNRFAHAGILRVADWLLPILLVALVGTIWSLIHRYRRASSLLRQQIKLVAFGGSLQLGLLIILWGIHVFLPLGVVAAVGSLSGLITPVALAVAIFRFRLYDIDRLVSRTVSYALLAALLAAVYFGGVLGLQIIFPSSGDLAVAGTTLAVAGLLSPLRRRLHDSMDRRFNRERFNAARVSEAFAARIATVNGVEALNRELSETLVRTLSPSAIGIWVRH